MPTLVHAAEQIGFDQPGKRHYQVAFHLDGTWGYSLVPLTVINGTLYFSADDGTHGAELWKSDGTPGGTTLVADINTTVDAAGPHGEERQSGPKQRRRQLEHLLELHRG